MQIPLALVASGGYESAEAEPALNFLFIYFTFNYDWIASERTNRDRDSEFVSRLLFLSIRY